MDAKEVMETDGGFLLSLASGFALLAIYTIVEEPERVYAGMVDALT